MIRSTPILANCFIGAILLMFVLKSFKFRVLIRNRNGQLRFPHFYVIDRENNKWHFTAKIDLLPDPLFFVLFVGKFERMIRRGD